MNLLASTKNGSVLVDFLTPEQVQLKEELSKAASLQAEVDAIRKYLGV